MWILLKSVIFYYREEIHKSIINAIEEIRKTISYTQDKQLENTLKEAEKTKSHYKNVVDKYQKQISRYQSKINSSIAQQKELRKQLEENRIILNNRPVLI